MPDARLIPASLHWLGPADPVPPHIADWLGEIGSMTRRFEQHCREVTVQPVKEGFITRAALRPEEAADLPDSPRYWLREIVLLGDGVPWLLGRTVIPEETLTGPDRALVDLGTVPLGRYLFGGAALTRDYICFGLTGQGPGLAHGAFDQRSGHSRRATGAEQGVGACWARRSRLRLSGKPLLLTELFLADAPVYRAPQPTHQEGR
ncbi:MULTISPECIES: chorismate lyase [Yersiniaceae]|uniref:Chorismate pyruvate-lyase n=1 Tax=Nissabacter archeti TaxID=1917880 RepID=A0ABS5JK70_9GAMM|nr:MULTISPECIES: chorismate lyase [Yersiniaceae]MBS0970378.1 chorismate lyase [Nissabacter archeti]PLR45027.1 chorismate lyase [Chimaeribacter arupi]